MKYLETLTCFILITKTKFHKTVQLENYKKKIEGADMQNLGKQRLQILYSGQKNQLEKKDVPQTSQSSSIVFVEQPHTIGNNAKYQLVVEENKTETFSGSEKMLKDVINDFKHQLEGLSNSKSTKSPLRLFLKTSDSFADNLPDGIFRRTMKKTKENLEKYSRNTFIKPFLGHSEFSISLLLLDKLNKYFEKCGNEGFKQSYRGFNRLINDQVKINGDEFFYLSDKQVKNFFNLKFHDFKVESLFSESAKIDKTYYSNYLSRSNCMAIKFIPWEVIYTSDNSLGLFRKRELFQKERTIKKLGANYGLLPYLRFTFRKIFLLYTTLINKIYCSGKEEM
ncbi:hypothetical protein PPACK8108_LOCUS12190 [Phakopsora pachyrhizi]|uniref:Uncharacterized protein n=1 Tax=Phakopsora pachyrhizi TaxID=170000 RepID=A0AAV0B1H8_PHAPC|nr:hypothetical protein PPACK8108_LOCUS12190 [Phakopsora pachyrhizi]